ncbi:helicase associated domain-containing protein [Actinacidiphila glaucinigra]|uniref:helicase associated domain-containing protein n=1 Tax=Actinacidiphila glaucinigra TaxID=235986 RepID=UPI0037FBE08A
MRDASPRPLALPCRPGRPCAQAGQEPGEKPPACRTQAYKWAVNLRAARQFHAREGGLQVPRQHVEELTEPDGTVTEVKLGQFVDNTRRRAAKLNQDRRQELGALGMRW